MSILNTIQKRNNLNEISAIGDIGPGGAHHEYVITKANADESEILLDVRFQKGARKDPNAISGVLDGDLLEIVRDRLTDFQAGDFACHENAIALQHVEEALMWMNMRAENRASRNVLGTYNK